MEAGSLAQEPPRKEVAVSVVPCRAPDTLKQLDIMVDFGQGVCGVVCPILVPPYFVSQGTGRYLPQNRDTLTISNEWIYMQAL